VRVRLAPGAAVMFWLDAGGEVLDATEPAAVAGARM